VTALRAAFALLVCAAAPAAAAPDALSPLLSGTWQLNLELSEDLRATFQAGADRPAAREPDTAAPAAAGRDRTDFGLFAEPRLTIQSTGTEIRLRHGVQIERTVRARASPAGAIVPAPPRDWIAAESVAYWLGGALVIETRPAQGGAFIERYRLTAEGRLRLELSIQPPGASAPIGLLRVYDRLAGTPPAVVL
jgi:hypothetical protein